MLTLSPAAARALHLAAQGLLTPPRRKATKADVLDTIRRMAQLQIDTIHVVARSPYLVLFSRLGDFAPQWLDEHLAEARLFEYWSHEACFLPGDWLVFGCETSGLPAAVLAHFAPANRLRLPMRAGQRSLNLSNAVAVAVFEAWRQQGFAGAAPAAQA